MSKGIEEVVRERYAAVAASTLTNESTGVQAVAEAFGYSAEELQSIPAEANMGLSCGNPVATAHLRPGRSSLLSRASLPPPPPIAGEEERQAAATTPSPRRPS